MAELQFNFEFIFLVWCIMGMVQHQCQLLYLVF